MGGGDPAGDCLDATAADIRMDGPHLRYFEPEAQQVPPAVLLGIAVVKGGARMQDRVVVDEVHLAWLQGEFQHQLRPPGDLLEAVEYRQFRLVHLVSGRGLAGLDARAGRREGRPFRRQPRKAPVRQTHRRRKTDSNSRSHRERKGYGEPLQASIAVSDLNL